jgi:hypothetical protein
VCNFVGLTVLQSLKISNSVLMKREVQTRDVILNFLNEYCEDYKELMMSYVCHNMKSVHISVLLLG